MKKIILLLIISAQLSAAAQEIPRQSIEDSVIGWMKVYNFKGTKQPMKVEDKLYSANQLSICDSFANWMQASYVPKGGLGDVKKRIIGKLGPYNQNDAALPHIYGAVATVYFFLKYNSSNKLVPVNSLGVEWVVMANAVPGWEVYDLSSPSQYYFTMPSFDQASNGESIKKIHELNQAPHLKPYTSFWVRNMEGGNGFDYVLLSRDNRFPFIKLKKGEYLQAMEQAIPRVYELEKKKLYEKEQGDQKRVAPFLKILDDIKEKRLASLKKVKEKYKNRLEEIALVNVQPSITDLENERDPFSNDYLSGTESTSGRMPVYKVDPDMAELCKKDKPQWVIIGWTWLPNDPLEKHLHESIINNFNFDYVYNFFFDPEKVKGQQYKPLRSPLYKEAVVITDASETSKINNADKSIFFFEDFSTTAIGKKPNGWNSKLNYDGKPCIVATLDGEYGNWTEIKGNEALIPNQLKKPLPQNFTISYDMVAPQNFTWGGKGLAFQLSKETTPGNAESFLMVRIRPGFDGRNGEVEIETKFPSPPGYMNATKWMVAPGFSNNKKNNRITVTIKKKEENLQVFIDKNKIAEYEKAIPSALLFNAMSFTHGRSDAETEKFYISNIKITKE